MGLPVKIWAHPQRVFRIHPGEENSDFSGSFGEEKVSFFGLPPGREISFLLPALGKES